MKKLIFVSLCAVFFYNSAKAEDHISGPCQNYEGYERVDYAHTSMLLPLSGTSALLDPYSGEVLIQANGDGTFTYRKAVHSFGNTYIKYPSSPGSPFDPNVDNITITDIWARSLDPDHEAGEIPEQTGFDPCDPEMIPLSGGPATGGRYLGFSGTTYHADVCAVRLDDLEAYLPDYNVVQFTGDGDLIVYVQQAVVAANDFTPFVFTYDYKGYVEEGDPCWVGDYDANFPYQHSWDVNVIQMNPRVPKVNDVDVHSPIVIPGAIQIVPPAGWEAEPVTIGRYGYEAEDGSEITNAGLYTDFRVNAYYPELERGIATLTHNDVVVSSYVEAEVPKAKPRCGDWGYAIGDVDQDCDVDLSDFALQAIKWLACTDPNGEGCEKEEMMGIGIAFDASEGKPAKILYLYDDLNADILEPNDIILEYRGTAVSDGNELRSAMVAMDDVAAGETFELVLERDQTQIAVYPQAKLLWAGGYTGYETINAKCVYRWETHEQGPVAGEMCRCEPDPTVEWCRQEWYVEPWNGTFKVGRIGGRCVDSTGSTGSEPRIWRGQAGVFAK